LQISRLELQVEQSKEENREELLAMKEVLVKKQANFRLAISTKGQKLAEATMRLQLSYLTYMKSRVEKLKNF